MEMTNPVKKGFSIIIIINPPKTIPNLMNSIQTLFLFQIENLHFQITTGTIKY